MKKNKNKNQIFLFFDLAVMLCNQLIKKRSIHKNQTNNL